MPDRRAVGEQWLALFDWPLLFTTLTLALLGVVVIYSATFANEGDTMRGLYFKQLEWNFYGLVVLSIMSFVDYRVVERPAYVIYVVTIILLIAVLVAGKVISGSKRWLLVGGINFQPSEMMKLVLIITLTKHFGSVRDSAGEVGFQRLVIPGLLTLVPAVLIAKQPDLGTAVVLVAIFFAMAFVNGIKTKTLLAIMVGALVLVPVMWTHMKEYQKNRVLALVNPSVDPLGTGYHTIQSKIAIGSGGLMGKGLFEGTQSKLNFLPEKHTDFIFAVFAEEVGFVGVFLLLLLYLGLVLRMMDLVLKAKDRTGALMAAGVSAMFGFHFLYNISMTIGLTPIVGIPLPLLSYGGSSLLTNYAAIGLLISIRMRRFRHD
ncbi:MAG: rod shape-determining protein RodA [Nitrospinae bacterium]|nr:rod shape-determining protein RodA [Nitrospinota bacterium]